MKEDYTVYEYISINVKSDLEPMYIDCYKNFGWIHINNEKRDYYINSNPNLNTVEIKFKRDRNIKNKEELKRLQEKCEKAFLQIHKLEKNPQLLATIYALTIASVAAGLIAMSVLTIVKNMWLIGTVCGIVGLVGCIFPYLVYKNIRTKKETENKTKIDEQQNIIYDTYKEVRKILLENE